MQLVGSPAFERDHLRIAIVDYSGHPFQVQLSRELARRGHAVLHLHFSDFLTPKGRLEVDADDPPTLAIEAITLGRRFEKYSLVRRRFQELEIGNRITKRLALFEPDVVVGCNLPLDALDRVVDGCGTKGWPFVFWQQDIYSTAIRKILTRRLGWLGALIGRYYRAIERNALDRSAAIVVIAEEFVAAIRDDFKVKNAAIHVIENWAPLDEITPRSKANPWSERHGLVHAKVVLYTGTLGLKHDASKLLSLAQALKDRARTSLVVVSEGMSADWLASEAVRTNLSSLKVLPFQPFEAYSDVLGSADVLVALLEADAGSFSVPSKVLSYLCAGRPVVISAPSGNLAFRIVQRSAAGAAVDVDEQRALVAAVQSLLDDETAASTAAANGRRYAEETFEIGRIGDRFERVLETAAKAARSPVR